MLRSGHFCTSRRRAYQIIRYVWSSFYICVFDLFQCLLPHQLFDPLQVHLQQVFVVPALLLWAKKADQAQVRCEGYRRGASGNKDLISGGQRHAFFTALQTSVT